MKKIKTFENFEIEKFNLTINDNSENSKPLVESWDDDDDDDDDDETGTYTHKYESELSSFKSAYNFIEDKITLALVHCSPEDKVLLFDALEDLLKRLNDERKLGYWS